MKIKELHKDIERYLQHDCYCPHEVYSFDGFGYQHFYEDQECEKIGANKEAVACIAHPFNEEKNRPQVVLFTIDGDKCVDALRFDATENNIEMTKIFIEKGVEGLKASGMKFNEYNPGEMARSLKQILSLSNGLVIRD